MSGAGEMPIHPTFLSDACADEGHRLAFGPPAQSGSPITDALESKAEDCLPRGTGTGWFAPITCCRRRLSPLIPSFGHAGAAGARSRAIRERISTSAETRLPRRGRGRDMGKSGTAAIHTRGCAKTPAFNLRVESSSRFGQSKNQKFWRRLFEEGNRENGSTLSWLAHVFTRPAPTSTAQPCLREVGFGSN
jgi:hypothetical protein